MNKRKIAALVIVLAGLVLSLSLITSGNQKKGNAFITILPTDGKVGVDTALKFKNLASLSYSGIGEAANQNTGNKKTNNLTQKLTDTYIQEFLKTNQGELQNVNGRTGLKPPDGTSLENLLQENLNQGIAFKTFELKDVRISGDNSKENQLAYIEEFGAAGKKDFGSFHETIDQMLDSWINRKNAEPLNQYLDISSKQINSLLALETPDAWKDFHLQNLNLWEKKLEVYMAILNGDDPLKTALAIKQVPDLIQESGDLQAVLEEKIKELDSK